MRFLSICALLLCACIVPAPSTESAPEKQKAIVANAPPLQLKSGANMGDKIEISGLVITPGAAIPGEAVKISGFYKVLDDIAIDYNVFVHVEDIDGRVDRINADHAPAGGQYPTTKWKKGETVRDDFQVFLPPGMQVRALNVLMGFWDPKADTRLPLRNADVIRNDGRDRVLVGSFPVQQ